MDSQVAYVGGYQYDNKYERTLGRLFGTGSGQQASDNGAELAEEYLG
jgi:hypothetical protein